MNLVRLLGPVVAGGVLLASCTIDSSDYVFGTGGSAGASGNDGTGAAGAGGRATGGGGANQGGSDGSEMGGMAGAGGSTGGSSDGGSGGVAEGGSAGAGGTDTPPPDPCAPNPCENGGTCELNGTGFLCTCPDGYEGKRCEVDIDDCDPNPCENAGSCVDGPNRFSCDCEPGFSGTTCEISVSGCEDEPCLNGGTCVDGAAPPAYTCTCPAGYDGNNCQTNINECSPNPCLHGGTCTDKVNGFTCSCTGTGYSGTTCQTDINECSPTNPCQNSGSCVNSAGGFSCTCGSRFTGATCQFQKFMGIGVLAFDATSTASALSGDGTTLVGYSSDSSNVTHAIRFVGAGPIQYLVPPTGSACYATGVSSNGGVVVGVCSFDSPEAGTPGRRSFRYTPATGIVTIPPTPLAADTDIDAAAVSDDGNVVVGHTLPYLGVRWTQASGWVLLGRLSPNGENWATAVNRDGSVVVGIDAPSASMSWRWTAATGQVQLTRPGAADDSYNVWGVSPNGNIIVGDNYASGAGSAIRWVNGTPTSLGLGSALATNADGSVVVGTKDNVATVWNSTGAHTVTSLLGTTSDLTGWTLTYTTDVSDDGKVIIGAGTHGGMSEGWIAHLP